MSSSTSTNPARPFVVVGRLVDIVLLAVIAIGLSSVILGRVVPLLGHPVYVVAGPSMVPAIPVGAAVVLESVATADLAIGDVVSLRNGPDQAVFTHRIVRIAERDGETWIETRGDANDQNDPSLTPSTAVIGRVGVSIPGAGYLLALLSTVPGLVLVLSTGVLLLVLGWWLDSLAADRRALAPTPVPAAPLAPAPAPVPSGPLTAVDLARGDRSGRRRRQRADLARTRT